MSDRTRVAETSELEPGERTIVEVKGRELGVFNVDGEYYAILNHCLHQGGPVCEGRVRGQLVGEYTGVGERVDEQFTDEPEVACPWHGWSYDLETGEHLGDSEFVLPTYNVVVSDGVVYIES